MLILSRMESTGVPNKIHVSAEFVEALHKQGKSHWAIPREDQVYAKGKGSLQTYFLNFKENYNASMDDDRQSIILEGSEENNNSQKRDIPSAGPAPPTEAVHYSGKVERLINWNLDLLTRLLKEIIASRKSIRPVADSDALLSALENHRKTRPDQRNVISEVKEIIELPGYRKCKHVDPESIELEPEVVEQLRKFIVCVAELYHENPFHNFEHASHVTMSVVSPTSFCRLESYVFVSRLSLTSFVFHNRP
jgi:hypothetical protein